MKKDVFRGWKEYEYWQWLIEKIDGYMGPYYNYSKLLHELHDIEFTWSLKRDENRAFDGISLRRDYAFEHNLSNVDFNITSCSVLEMLIALSMRCEYEIMWDGSAPRFGRWFWIMIENLDLLQCNDDHFDGDFVRNQIKIWLDRVYNFNGTGSIFPLKNTHRDQRKVEIWFQMCGYLNENYFF